MTADVVFADGDGLLRQYAVGRDEWIAINDRVAVVIDDQAIAPEVSRYVPNYGTLLADCITWRTTTFPGLIAQAVTTNLFATQAQKVLSQLSQDLVGLAPGDPVPASATFIIRVQLKALAASAGQDAVTAARLASQVDEFVSANRAADAALEGLPDAPWPSIAGPIGALESALSDVGTAWDSITAQLEAASSDQVPITTAGLLSSNLGTAIAGWSALAQAAAAFDSMASNLTSAGAL